jgi:alcohol dehydrogenase, propanol-preferring
MKAARITETKEPLRIQELDHPAPKNEEVLVRVESCGICHSDIHLWEGGYAGPQGKFMSVKERGVEFPLTPGHEIAGRVEEIGGSVSGFKEGDKVLVYPWIGEGTCPACRIGEENLCDSPRTLGIYQDGGYAEEVIVPSYRYLINIGNMDVDSAGLLACSGLTAYTAVSKSQALASENLLVVGAGGGLGLMAVQIAKAVTNSNVIALDVDDEKLEEAQKNGADEVINSKTSDAIKRITDLTGGQGAETIIDFVNNDKTALDAIKMLRKRGKLIMVGLYGGSFELGLAAVPLRAFTLTGAYTGKFADLAELIALAKSGKIKPVVSNKVGLDDVNNTLEELKEGKIAGRAVLTP